MITRLTKKLCRKWIKALRSGKYRQGRGALKRGNQYGTSYCCLGVAEDAIGLERLDRSELREIKGLSRGVQRTLMNMNDSGAADFNEIAAHIEKAILPALED